MSSVIVRCIRGLGDKEAQPISDPLITSESCAVRRGKRFLDDPSQGGYYLSRQNSIRVPHRLFTDVVGKWIEFLDMTEGEMVSSKVLSYEIEITPQSVFASVATERYEDVNG